jgi:hypothetical protein
MFVRGSHKCGVQVIHFSTVESSCKREKKILSPFDSSRQSHTHNAQGVICEDFASFSICIVGSGRLFCSTVGRYVLEPSSSSLGILLFASFDPKPHLFALVDPGNGFTIIQFKEYIQVENLLAGKSYALIPQGQATPTDLNASLIPVSIPISTAYADTLDVLGFAEVWFERNQIWLR